MWLCLSAESADEARGPKAVHHLVKVMGGRLPIRKHGREDAVWLGAITIFQFLVSFYIAPPVSHFVSCNYSIISSFLSASKTAPLATNSCTLLAFGYLVTKPGSNENGFH